MEEADVKQLMMVYFFVNSSNSSHKFNIEVNQFIVSIVYFDIGILQFFKEFPCRKNRL